MTLLSHHAHIFIGPLATLKDIVFDMLKKEGVLNDDTLLYTQKTTFLTVEDAHDIKQFISQKASTHRNTLAVIFVENFSQPAQNALLKIVEEPGGYSHIIFVTPHEHLLLQTIKSRSLLHYITSDEEISPLPVSPFLRSKPAERLSMIDEYLKKNKNLDSKEVKQEISIFLSSLEKKAYHDALFRKNNALFEAIFFAKKYIMNTGSSTKQLLEYIALT